MPGLVSHVFILGKNYKLSLAELLHFMITRDCGFRIRDVANSFVVADTGKLAGSDMISGLGGTLKIGRVTAVMPTKTVEDAFIRGIKDAQTDIKSLLSSNNVTGATFVRNSVKYLFGVSIYLEGPRFLGLSRNLHRFIGSYFKKELISGGAKAQFMGTLPSRMPPQLTNVEVLKKKLIEKSAEVLFCIGRQDAFLSRTTAVHNPFEFQRRDIHRPVQRKIFSIPPRVARIMANLASCLPGKTLLDPFCGVGTILQEAMLGGARVIGIDNDPWCVEASIKNLQWLQRIYDLEGAKYRVMVGDARKLTQKVEEGSVDCIATEPALGPALRDIPTESYAKRIISGLEPMYNDFLREAYTALKNGGRVVFVTPYVRTRRGTFCSLDITDRAFSIGFRTVLPFEDMSTRSDNYWVKRLVENSSLVDIEERHKIGREIHILQK